MNLSEREMACHDFNLVLDLKLLCVNLARLNYISQKSLLVCIWYTRKCVCKWATRDIILGAWEGGNGAATIL